MNCLVLLFKLGICVQFTGFQKYFFCRIALKLLNKTPSISKYFNLSKTKQKVSLNFFVSAFDLFKEFIFFTGVLKNNFLTPFSGRGLHFKLVEKLNFLSFFYLSGANSNYFIFFKDNCHNWLKLSLKLFKIILISPFWPPQSIIPLSNHPLEYPFEPVSI